MPGVINVNNGGLLELTLTGTQKRNQMKSWSRFTGIIDV